MSSTYLALCQKYQRDSGIVGSTIVSAETFSTPMEQKICEWIADADEFAQNIYSDWPFLRTEKTITLSSGTDTYTLTDLSITDWATWSHDDFVINPGTDEYGEVSYVPYEEWLKSSERLGVKESSEPSSVTIKPNGTLVFMDKPDSSYTVWSIYFKSPTRLSSNTDTSDIPSRFERIILARTKMYHGEYYGDWELYQSGEKEYNALFTQLEAWAFPDNRLKTIGAADLSDMVTEVV